MYTALHYAAEYGQHELAQTLLSAGVDVNAKGSGSTTALHRAGQHAVAQVLLSATRISTRMMLGVLYLCSGRVEADRPETQYGVLLKHGAK